MPSYISLDDDVGLKLRAVLMASNGDVGYFDHDSCPYSDSLKEVLRKLLVGDRGGVAGVDDGIDKRDRIFAVAENDKFDVVLSEIEATIEELKSVERSIRSTAGGKVDSGDQIQLIKAKTALLEKWITQKERLYGLKEVSEFQSIVVSFMSDVLDKDQISDFRKRLAGLRSVTGFASGGVVSENLMKGRVVGDAGAEIVS